MKKNAPVAPPFQRVSGAVGFREDLHDGGPLGIHVGQPRVAGSLVVNPVDRPLGQQFKIVLEIVEER